MTLLQLIITALATYRLTRLVTADKITEPIRDWITARHDWFGYLVTCDWCLSIWVAPFPVLLMIKYPNSDSVMFFLGLLCASALTGLFSLVEGRLDT